MKHKMKQVEERREVEGAKHTENTKHRHNDEGLSGWENDDDDDEGDVMFEHFGSPPMWRGEMQISPKK